MRVFGIFVAVGIMVAFLVTITFIPAYLALLNDARIATLSRASRSCPGLASAVGRFGRGPNDAMVTDF
ncbi:MAG: MMPL family transporter [Gemmatimonadota bacterium]